MLLIAAAVASGVIGDVKDTLAIVVIVLLNAVRLRPGVSC
jgi:hypothetical protein